MRVLQILPELNHGGVERGTIDLALALKARGHDPYVVSNGGVLVKQLEKAKVHHISLPVHKKSLSSLFLVGKLADLLIREKIDIVHARSRIPAWIAYFACKKVRKKTGVQFVTTCHGYYSTHIFSRVMGFGKRVIVISKAIGNHIHENFNVTKERMDLIYRGVDLSSFEFNIEKYQSNVSQFNIVNIGRITSLKGHSDFIRAFHLVHRKHPHTRAWIVGGANGKRGLKLEAYLKDLVDELDLKEVVQFLGPRNDIPEILKRAHLLVLSTKTPEGFGRVIVESAASGTAVVATRVGGVSEIVDHEVNGLLVPPSNSVLMSEAMVKMIENQDLCIQYAHALRKKVEENFSLDLMFEKTIKVYEKLQREKKILVIKLGALGDLVLVIPSLRMLKEKFPKSHISILVDEKWIKVVQGCPYLDEIIPFKRDRLWSLGFRFPALCYLIRNRSFDLSIDFQNNFKTHLLAFLAQIPERFGYIRGKGGRLLNRGTKGFNKLIPPLDHQFQLLKELGIKTLDDRLELWASSRDELQVRKQLEKSWVSEDAFLVGFALGASSKWVTKRWPLEWFVHLAEELQKKYQARIVLIGAAQENHLAEKFLQMHSKGVVNLVGKTSLGELIALTKKFRVLVTPDSAPLHIAAASLTPVVALFGPTSPEKHVPPSKKIRVHWKQIKCAPCYSNSCHSKVQLDCMKQITVEEVLDSIEEIKLTHVTEPLQNSH